MHKADSWQWGLEGSEKWYTINLLSSYGIVSFAGVCIFFLVTMEFIYGEGSVRPQLSQNGKFSDSSVLIAVKPPIFIHL